MTIFSVAGWSGCGKTTVIARLIEYFKTRNMKVVAVKGAGEYTLQPETKDSGVFLGAGADRVWLVAGREVLNIRRVRDEGEAGKIVKADFADADVVLLEGFYLEDVPKIEVFDSRRHRSLRLPPAQLAAVIADRRVTEQVPYFHRDDIEGIARFMEDYNSGS
jgi:molybdopterin-guanine dinucleotide biosynthesis protein MobB